jgi:ribose-phosphate pyrophosphokinase
MEAVLMGDAVHRASCKEVTFIIPYFGYARQDRKSEPHTPISASTVAAMLEKVAGANRVVTIDLHCGQIQGFFSKDVPVDNVYASIVAAPRIAKLALKNPVVVSPDAGGVDRASKFQKALAVEGMMSDFAMISKKRAKAGVIESMALVGDVGGHEAIIIDDMCDTGGTLCKAGEELLAQGATSVYAFFTHPVFSKDALLKIKDSKFTKVFTTDTIPLQGEQPDNLEIISVAPLLAEVIKRIQNGGSVSEIFLKK